MGDFFNPIGVRHAAGVRGLHRKRPDRADQAGHRACTGRVDCALRADDHRLPVLSERDVEEDDFTLGLGGSFFQVIKPADH